jgi:deoxyribonuclease-4
MKKHKKTLLLGAHTSIEGGAYKAIERAHSIGCTVVQIFTKSNRQWFAKPLTTNDIEQFKKAVSETQMCATVSHASYLINLASPKAETRTRSIDALKKELERCHTLEIDYLVLHPGSPVSQGAKQGIELIAKGLDSVLGNYTGSTMLLLETMAGQGSSLGGKFEEIAALRKQSKHKKKIGVCFDTCHAFAAGYDFRTKSSYTKMWHDFDKTIGIKHLKAMHINDSKKELDSHVDRHEDIGKGKIGKDAFAFLFNDPRFFDIPKILETPKETLQDDEGNIATIKQLLTEKTKKALHLK